MNYISTTELRTKAQQLRDSLSRGESVYLFHRSKVIGVVEPYEDNKVVATSTQLKRFSVKYRPKKLVSREDRKKVLLKHLEEKYGKRVS